MNKLWREYRYWRVTVYLDWILSYICKDCRDETLIAFKVFLHEFGLEK